MPLPARSRDVTGLPGAPAYDGPMQPGVLGQASGPVPGPGLLVPGPLRRRAVALLAACVAVTVVLGVRFAGYGLPDWLDATFDPRIQAHLGRFPVLLNWLPDLGTRGPVAVMTLALVLAYALTLDLLASAVGPRPRGRPYAESAGMLDLR